MDRVGFGVIGAGLFGENHALVYSRLPGVELVAVCDQNEERAREVAERYGARAHSPTTLSSSRTPTSGPSPLPPQTLLTQRSR